uniref:Murine leukemia virus integrase C-terminal domain-containing protein n=1 Tax=Myotis myotis TaxID=51298 RepID=A0A7J7WHR4_MYOMY|nr:hypothetical protein mMyoMyo1_012143 [Myotis myotis]
MSARRVVRAVWEEDTPRISPTQPAFSPGDLVWVKRHDPGNLEPRWDGPYQVVLSTPAAIEVAGKRHWIHRTQVKAADSGDSPRRWKVELTQAPHYAWGVIRTTDGVVLARETGTSEPTLRFDLCSLFREDWNLPQDRPRLMNLGSSGSQLGIPGEWLHTGLQPPMAAGPEGLSSNFGILPYMSARASPGLPF